MLKAVLLAAAVSADAFAFAFSYGAKKTKLPFWGLLIISLFGGGFLGLSLAVASFAERILPPEISADILGGILILLGLFSTAIALFKIELKTRSKILLKKIFGINMRLCFSYCEEGEKNVASIKEAAAIGVALSIDSLAAGLAAGMTMTPPEMIASGLIAVFGGMALQLVGFKLGEKLARHVNQDLSYLSGLILLALGVVTVIGL